MRFDQIYNPENFLHFLSDFLPDDFVPRQEDIVINPKRYKGIKQARIIGFCESLGLSVLEMTHDSENDPRVAIATDAFKILADHWVHKALVIFKSSNSDNYRFSYLTISLDLNEKNKPVKRYSNARRYSFYLGPNAKVNTPTKFLIQQKRIVNLDDLQERFSLEVVNKEFYKEISANFIKLVGGVVGTGKNKKTYESALRLPSISSKSQISMEFGVRLIGRIIFCWFLREKKSHGGSALMPKELLSSVALKKHSDYYHKILEPIFFEVLNKEDKSREMIWLTEPFARIPYLNGGLFSPSESDYYKRRGSEQSLFHNTLVIPDKWFEEFFETLETYNFTIDENTSFDQELSIDPEMLGRIFENLLAEINPETGESARKSTGSFYTPRAIVDYMVDESLHLFLEQKTNINTEKLHAVISYDLADDVTYPLDDVEKDKIIDALEKLKLLDPACGSGAFPIGALQKIVFVLQQVDPDAQLWFKKQIATASPEIRRVIEREFSFKNFNYIRKLGVIKENIYGVDIQPIATEISRLRCFLTLVVDQRIDDMAPNRGIEPLPNLDFKFVTANSLIALPKEEQSNLFKDKEGIDQLKNLRNQFFNATNSERYQLKDEFKEIQKRMLLRMIQMKSGDDTTQMLSAWDPFSNKTVEWFDPEWMFGIEDGFDVVIANPPYLKERDNKKTFESVNGSEFGKKYHQGKMDFWFYFLHKAIDLVKPQGAISYITSRYWLNSQGAKKLIKRVSAELSFVRFIDIGKLKVFEAVAGHHMVAVYQKTTGDKQFLYKMLQNDLSDIASNQDTKNVIIKKLSNASIFSEHDEIILASSHQNIKDVIPLVEVVDISQGVVQNPDKVSAKASVALNLNAGAGVFVLTQEEYSQLSLSDVEKTFVKKFYDEKDLRKYHLEKSNFRVLLYLTRNNCPDIDKYPNLRKHLERYRPIMEQRRETKKGTVKWFQLHWPSEARYFESPKIVMPAMFQSVPAAYVDEEAYFGLSSNVIVEKNKEYDLKYILAILNSNFATDWFSENGKKRGIGLDVGVGKLGQFPIKIATASEQKVFTELVDKVISVTSTKGFLIDIEKQQSVKKYEEQIDQLVNELYGLGINSKK